MLNTFRMPKCYNTFKSWVTSKHQFIEIYKQMGSPRPIDVTFREGILSLAEEEQKMFSIADYDTLFKTIAHNHRPKDFRVRNYLLYDVQDFKNNINTYHNNINYLKNYLKLNSDINIAVNDSDNVKEYFKHGIYNITIPIILFDNNDFNVTNYVEVLDTHIELTKNLKQPQNVNIAIFGINSAYFSKQIVNKYYKHISSITLFERGYRNELYSTLIELNKYMDKHKLNLNIQHNSSQEVDELDTIIFIHKCLDLGIHNFEVSYFKTSGSPNLLKRVNNQHSIITYDMYYKAIATYILQKCYGISYEDILLNENNNFLVDI